MTASSPSPAAFEKRLDRLARIAVRVGLGLAPGQEVVMTAPVEALPLARLVTEHAYRAGASLVTTLFEDEASTLLRYRLAPEDSFDRSQGWLYDGMAAAYRSGAARLAIRGNNPALLAGQNPAKVARANRAMAQAYRPALDLITNYAINWSIVPFATPAWARAMFPDEAEDVAVARLWNAIFASARVDAADPVAAWEAHNRDLQGRATRLNGKAYAALRFRGPGTDLTVGLADGHDWLGGSTTAQNGLVCNPNIPTEEVFTTPHRERVDGEVASTKPLSYQGTLIEDIRVRFEAGRIVEARARTGEAVLRKVLETDEGAVRLGEVALVPFSSPISRSGLLFYNTLFDENAASHIALGQAYASCIRGGASMEADELARRGANASLIHIDWMIGSGEVDVDGITAEGGAEQVMRRGEWAD